MMAMGHTITEKIFARATGLDSVRAGENHAVRPSRMIAYDCADSARLQVPFMAMDKCRTHQYECRTHQ